MVVVVTIKEMSSLLVGIFYDLWGPFCIYICDMKFFGCTVCFNLAIMRKRICLPPSRITYFYRCL